MYFSSRSFEKNSKLDAIQQATENLCGPLSSTYLNTLNSIYCSIDTRKVGTFNCSRVAHSASKISKSWEEISQGASNCYLLIFQLSGTCECEQLEKKITLSPSKVTLINNSLPFTLKLSPNTVQFLLHIPHEHLQASTIKWDNHTVRYLSSVTASIIKSLITTAFAQDQCSDSIHALTLNYTIISLIKESLLVNSTNSVTAPTPNTNKDEQLNIIKKYLLNQLSNREFTPKIGAQALGLSERQLHRVFKASGFTVSNWIKQNRLDRCAIALSDSTQNHKRISEIAHLWGFSDAAHFSRSFRVEYGQTPRAYRISAQSS